ncbi:MAG: AAC(3) family N-acetyltransferase [Candidatus Omnitrophica bacterium]|nr:AAC(3) family N-acetyltransferase [Candidatus Omnitrophota bacterium]
MKEGKERGKVVVRKQDLIEGFIKLELKKCGLVMVHSSLSSFGYVVGGAKTVIESLLEIIDEGTLVFPTFTFSTIDSERPPFNPKKTPSVVGEITEVFWRQGYGLRSHHPTHSIAAKGKDAEELIKNHEKFTPFSFEGPFGKIYKSGGYILLLGVDCEVISFFHAIEEWVKLPYLFPTKAKIEVNGKIEIVEVPLHPPGHRRFKNITDRLEKDGKVKKVLIGNALCKLFSVRELVEYTVKMMEKKPDILLRSDCLCEFCSLARKFTYHIFKENGLILPYKKFKEIYG